MQSVRHAGGMEREIRKSAVRQSIENFFHLSNRFCSQHLMEVKRVTVAFLQAMTRGFNIHSDQVAVCKMHTERCVQEKTHSGVKKIWSGEIIALFTKQL